MASVLIKSGLVVRKITITYFSFTTDFMTAICVVRIWALLLIVERTKNILKTIKNSNYC